MIENKAENDQRITHPTWFLQQSNKGEP